MKSSSICATTLRRCRSACAGAFVFAAFLISVGATYGTVVYNETVTGDLSDNQAAPTSISVAPGTNSIVGTVGGSNTQDWITFTVPSGSQLNSVVLASYLSSDSQGFTGLQAGTSFVGSPFSASSYLGYAHYGTAATNGPELPTNVVGINILPAMGNNAPGHTADGAQGFVPPLPSGSYTFLIQQLGGSTSYQFDYGVVPEPHSIFVLLAATPMLMPSTASQLKQQSDYIRLGS